MEGPTDYEEESKYKEGSAGVEIVHKSFHTNSTSTANFKSGLVLENMRKNIGLVFKSSLPDLIRIVFIVMKEMEIIWKKWNSDYIYKCQTGIPIKDVQKYNKANERIETFYENDLIKFFLHFSILPKKKEILDFDQRSKTESEYLVSFIWIKGNTLKYLDFVSAFRLNISLLSIC